MHACSTCGEPKADRRYGVCLECVRAERVAQGLPASIYDDPDNVEFLAGFAARAARKGAA